MKILSWQNGECIYECDAQTKREAVQAAVQAGVSLRNANLRNANLRNADLSDADLSDANLRNANLRNADLWNANLRNANLSDADLSDADLSDANLSDANLSDADLSDAKYNDEKVRGIYQVAGVGSERRMTVAIITLGEIHIQCGCFRDTMEKFKEKIEQTHADNARYLTEYRAVVAFIEACAEAARTET